MNHSGHLIMESTTVNHEHMNHDNMDHSNMDHSNMDHSNMDHSNMDHSNMDHSNMDHSSMGHDMMKMYFHCSTNATILFDFWRTTSWQGMLGSCIAVFVLASCYEGLKVLREFLLRRANAQAKYKNVPVTSNGETDVIVNDKPNHLKILSLPHLIQTILHILQIVLSYFLMLIFMTYNVYLCIAIALGAGVGYFLFSWKRAVVVDINEHCH